MPYFLNDSILGDCGGQTVGMPMVSNCAPMLADSSLYSYKAEFIQNVLKSGNKKIVKEFNLTFRYTADVL